MEARDIALWAALAGVGLLAGWGLVRVSELQSELDALEVRLEDQTAWAERFAERRGGGPGQALRGQGRMGRRGTAVREDTDPSGGSLDLEDPDVREQVESLVVETQERQWEERRARMLEHRTQTMEDELSALAEDYDLSDEQVQQVRASLEGFFSQVDEIRELVRSGELDPGSMREEVMSAREQTQAAITESVGEEASAALWDQMPRGPGMGMGPPDGGPPGGP